MVRCVDGTLYTGYTTDLARRIREHNGEDGGGARATGARYTRARRPVTLIYHEKHLDRSGAQAREAAIKRFTKEQKEDLVKRGLR